MVIGKVLNCWRGRKVSAFDARPMITVVARSTAVTISNRAIELTSYLRDAHAAQPARGMPGAEQLLNGKEHHERDDKEHPPREGVKEPFSRFRTVVMRGDAGARDACRVCGNSHRNRRQR